MQFAGLKALHAILCVEQLVLLGGVIAWIERRIAHDGDLVRRLESAAKSSIESVSGSRSAGTLDFEDRHVPVGMDHHDALDIERRLRSGARARAGSR